MKLVRALGLATAPWLSAGCLALVLSMALALPATAQDDAASSRSATFQAVEGPSTEDVAGVPLLFGAYGTVLALLLGYVLWLGRLQSVTTRDIERLRQSIEQASKATSREG